MLLQVAVDGGGGLLQQRIQHARVPLQHLHARLEVVLQVSGGSEVNSMKSIYDELRLLLLKWKWRQVTGSSLWEMTISYSKINKILINELIRSNAKIGFNS